MYKLFRSAQCDSAAMAPDPMWRHVTILQQYAGSGGSRKWKCNYCGFMKTGSVTRVKDHLAGVPNKDVAICGNVPADVKSLLDSWKRNRIGLPPEESTAGDGNTSQATQAQSSKRARPTDVESRIGTNVSHAVRTPLPQGESSSMQSATPNAPVTSVRGSIERADIVASFQKQAKLEATREITRLFIRCAIPFNVAKTKQWKKAMTAISRIGCEWEGPNHEALGERAQERENMH